MEIVYEAVGTLKPETTITPEGVMSLSQPVHECQSCFAIVRDQERHTQWHRRQSISHIVPHNLF